MACGISFLGTVLEAGKGAGMPHGKVVDSRYQPSVLSSVPFFSLVNVAKCLLHRYWPYLSSAQSYGDGPRLPSFLNILKPKPSHPSQTPREMGKASENQTAASSAYNTPPFPPIATLILSKSCCAESSNSSRLFVGTNLVWISRSELRVPYAV